MEFIHQEKSLLSELMNKNSESTDSTVNNALQKQSQFYDSLNKQFEIRPPEKSPMQNSFPKLAPTVLNGQPKENTDPKESNELPKTAEQPVEDPTPAPAAAPTAGPTAVPTAVPTAAPTSIPASVEQTTSVAPSNPAEEPNIQQSTSEQPKEDSSKIEVIDMEPVIGRKRPCQEADSPQNLKKEKVLTQSVQFKNTSASLICCHWTLLTMGSFSDHGEYFLKI